MSKKWKRVRAENRKIKKNKGYTRPVPEGWVPSANPNGGAHPPQGAALLGVSDLELPRHDWLVDE